MKKKLFYNIFTILAIILVTSNVYAAQWVTSMEELPTGYRFQYGSYVNLNYLAISKFFLNPTAENTIPNVTTRRGYCIQKSVSTWPGRLYDMDVVGVAPYSLIENYSFNGENTGLYYYNSVLDEYTRRAINIAAMWEKTYYPENNAAVAATQMFIWGMTTGAASEFQSRAGETTGSIPVIHDGYKYVDIYGPSGILSDKGLYRVVNGISGYHSDTVDTDGDGIEDTRKECVWDSNLTIDMCNKFYELCSYFENYKSGMPNFVLTQGTDNLLYPGETIRYTDTNGMFHLGEFTIDTKDLPAGVTMTKDGNDLVVSVASNYSGYFKGEIPIKRYALNNPGESRIYSNGVTQILFEGYMPEQSINVEIEVVSMKAKVQKRTVSTSGKKGDSKLAGAVYSIYRNPECTEFVERITTDETGVATSNYLDGVKFYAKETACPEGTLLNDRVYELDIANAIPQADGTLLAVFEAEDTIIESNLKITKKLGETDYDPKVTLSGVQFELTLNNDPSQVFQTNISGEDGICEVKNIPYGVYTCREIKLNDMGYKVDDLTINFIENGKTYSFEDLVDDSKEMKIEITKKLIPETVGKTDATVEGAYFTVYTDAQCKTPYVDKNGDVVVIGPTDRSGYAISKKMRTGTYYVKETVFPKGIDKTAVIPEDTVTYEDKIYTFSEDNKTQTERVVKIVSKDIYNKPITAKMVVRKMDETQGTTTSSPAEGAVLTLTLVSSKGRNPEVVYEATVDSTGRAEFENIDIKALGYEHTIPYGVYTLKEKSPGKDGHSYLYYIDDETVNIDVVNEEEYRVVTDKPVELYPKVVKVDSDTKKQVKLAGFKFKIYKLATSADPTSGWVTQLDTKTNKYIDVFETAPNGEIMTPEKITAGEYIFYEVDSPKGYYIDPKMRIPEDESQYGNKDNGVYKNITKVATGLKDDAAPEDVNKDLTYKIEVSNKPLVGTIDVYKTGKMLVSSKVTTDEEWGEIHQAVWEDRPLEGVKYEIYTAEDIKYPDGTGNYYNKDIKVDTIVTGENGHALSKELYPGKYYLREVDAPEGVILNPEKIPVTVTSEDKYTRVNTIPVTQSNDRQKLTIKINKIFEESNLNIYDEYEKEAIFTVTTLEDIRNNAGNVEIPKGSIVGIVKFDGNNQISEELDLPAGKYHVEEVYASFPYSKVTEGKDVTVKGDKTNAAEVEFDGGKYINTPILRDIILVKFSATSFADANNVGLIGAKYDKEIVSKGLEEFLSEVKAKTYDELVEIIKEQKLITGKGAVYAIYLDKDCQKPLKYKDTNKNVEFTTDENGLFEFKNLPLGTYYLKEMKAPVYIDGDIELEYTKSEEPVKIVLDEEQSSDNLAIRGMWDESTFGTDVYKTDIFTGDPVPNCVFEILDKDKNVIYHSTSDSDGLVAFPLDILTKGETYYFHEIDAPDLYKEGGKVLNTDYHEFKADYKIEDGKIVFDKVLNIENTRGVRNVLIKKIDEKTGEPLKGCKFSIVLLNENGEEYVNNNGEKVYAVKDAVTDENGECLLGDVPFGSYKFIEVEAPERYNLAEQNLEGLGFTINEDTPETLIFEVTNTGDIAVYVLVAVAAICVLGIVFVIVRKRKASK